jgi:membrane fusion protein (multidrug efflux system)
VSDSTASPPPPHGRRLVFALSAVVVAGVLGAVALAALRSRRVEEQRALLARVAEAGPRVLVAEVARPSNERIVTLPGDARAFSQTTLYAKLPGYVRDVRVDVGDPVRVGQVLAILASPETDQQVAAARTNLALQQRIAVRARALAPRAIVSQQDLDQANANLQVTQAQLRAMLALQEYEVLRAPFDGVVTARYVDPGALLPASQTGQPVLDVSDPRRLRILVYVGQDVAPFVRVGDPAVVTVDQLPGERVAVRVSRTANALDPRSRSMLVQLWTENDPSRGLIAGLFVHVLMRVRVPPFPSVPVEAIVARGDRTQVALVQERRLHFVDVTPGLNDGRKVQIRAGLSGGETVALSPPSDLGDGAPIQPVTARHLAEASTPPPARSGGAAPGGPVPDTPLAPLR